MKWFRVYLAAVLVTLAAYTLTVGWRHGWDLLPVFFADIAATTWSGQFNLDFMTFLGSSALWVAWRHRFTPGGIGLGVAAFFGGMPFLAPYLLRAGAQAGDDARAPPRRRPSAAGRAPGAPPTRAGARCPARGAASRA